MASIVVTGGAGFIGSNIVARLARRADTDVYVADRLREADSGKWKNLAKHDIADIIAPEELLYALEKRFPDGLQAVVHMGAISSTTEPDVDRIVENNFRLSKAVWDWCASRNTPLVYASSAATYGDGADGFIDDNAYAAVLVQRPLNAYGWSKKMFDLYALREAAKGNAPPKWSGLRFFNVYGPNEYHKGGQKSVVAHLYPKAAAGEQTRLFKSHHPDYPDGGQKRDFVFVDDCVDVVEWLLTGEKQSGVVNVGSGRARTFLELTEALYAAIGRKPDVHYVETPADIRKNYQYFTEADLTRLRSLGYEKQFTSIEAGVGKYVKEYLSKDDPYV